MTYFLKKKKWMAWVVLLTFLFTSFMPSNILAGNSVAEAADVVAVIGDTEYATLQAAVDAAQDGDTIVLLKDVQESVSSSEDKRYTLNLNGHIVTGDNNRVFTIAAGNLVIQNGTITGGQTTETGGGLQISNANVTLENCIVSENSAKAGGGIYVGAGASVTGTNLNILGNIVTNDGAGIYGNTATINLSDSTVSGNEGRNGGGIGLAGKSVVTFENIIISGNIAKGQGAALYITGTSEMTFRACELTNNIAKEALSTSAIYFSGTGNIAFDGCKISENNSSASNVSGNASTIYAYQKNLIFQNCLIYNNIADMVGGLYLGSAASAKLEGTVVKNNHSLVTSGMYATQFTAGGIGIATGAKNLEMVNSAVYNNTVASPTVNANDFSIFYTNTSEIPAASAMVDGAADFTGYVWEDDYVTRIEDALTKEIRESQSKPTNNYYHYTVVAPTNQPIYWDGLNGDDASNGLSAATPVKTMTKVQELVENSPVGETRNRIYVIGKVTVNDEEIWNLPDITLYRYLGYEGLLVDVASGGSLTLQNITLDGSLEQGLYNNDSLIKVEAGGILVVGQDAVLQNNDASHGTTQTAAAENWGGAIKNYGNLVVKGTIQNCSAFYGGGIYSGAGSVVLEEGALIQNNSARLNSNVLPTNDYNVKASGGGIMLTGGTLTMQGGTIASNSSSGNGGGIALGAYDMKEDWSSEFTMNGGTIEGNTAESTGGGLYVQCNNSTEIFAGTIRGNTCKGSYEGQFGGGGIYVNGGCSGYTDGKVQLYNVVITDNDASFLGGGGIAGCPTSDISIYVDNGGAVYGNRTTSADAKDIYITSGAIGIHVGTAKAHFSVDMLGGGLNRWTSDDGEELALNSFYAVSKLAMQNYASAEDIAKAEEQAKVYITENHSGTRGGGIGSNGKVVIGYAPKETTQLTIKKQWQDNDNADAARPDEIKVWVLRNGEKIGFVRVTPDKTGNWLATLSSLEAYDADGNKYVYTVEEDTITGYQSELTSWDADTLMATFTNTQVIELNGQKIWLNVEGTELPETITVGLFCDNGTEPIATTTTSLDMNWRYSFGQQPKYAADGHAYQYTVREKVEGYNTYYEHDGLQDGQLLLNVINVKENPSIHIEGTKTWFDNGVESHPNITIELWQKDTNGNDWKLSDVQLSEEKGWDYDFGYWPKYDDNGNLYTYTVVEAEVPEGYVSIVSGYDVQNIQMALYEMGNISVSKKVTNTPENTTAFGFTLYVKAMHKIEGVLDEAQQRAQTLLATAKATAEKQLQAAELALYGNANDKGEKQLFEDSVFLTNTSASSYQFFATDSNETATMAVTTGSSIYAEHVSIVLEPESSTIWDGFDAAVAQMIGVINDLAEEFVHAVTKTTDAYTAEKDSVANASRPTTAVMLTRLAQEIEVTTGSAIAFEESKLDSMFDAMVAHKQALAECENVQIALEAFKASMTTPSAIVLIVNGDMTHPIELDPESGVRNETTGLWEFTVQTVEDKDGTAKVADKVYFNAETGEYQIPFTLLKDSTINFSLQATTGSAVQYRIEEDGFVTTDGKYVDTYIYNGNDLEHALETEKALSTDWADLTSGSAISYVFDNQYSVSGNPGEETPVTPPSGGGDGYDGPYSDDDTIIDDEEVPLAEPDVDDTDDGIEIDDGDVPLTDVPGEALEIDDEQVPLGDAPKTGDANNAIPFVVLMMMAGLGLVVTRRKFN